MIDEAIIQQMQAAIIHLNDSYTSIAIDVGILKSQMAEIRLITRGLVMAIVGLATARAWKIFINWRDNNFK